MKSIFQKIKSRKGETITEVLVAVLISGLALVMLAGAVTAAFNMVSDSKDNFTNYYAAENKMESRSQDAASGPGKISIQGNGGSVFLDPATSNSDVDVSYYVNKGFGQTVVSYDKK